LKHFSASRKGKNIYAYLTDLQGNMTFYHDANDLPMLFAPIWGICEATDPLWVNTMNFAFGSENKGGFYS
jgi:meiotically up-regulated gene 157 (Mug157) protein